MFSVRTAPSGADRIRRADVTHPLDAALAMQAKLWRQPAVDCGALEPGWATIAAMTADAAVLEDWLDHQGSFTRGLDLKGRAAALMADYSHLFAVATVPLFVGFGIVPDMAPERFALAAERRPIDFQGRVLEERVFRVRFLSDAFVTEQAGLAEAAAALVDRRELCERYRLATEAHFDPLVQTLHRRSGLARSALWRLVADAVAVVFIDAGQRLGRLDDAKASALAVLKQAGSPLANRQLGFVDIVVREDAPPCRVLARRTFRARGGCCRFYTAEGGKLCSTCVLLGPAERDVRLENAMRRRLGLPPRQDTASVASGQVAG